MLPKDGSEMKPSTKDVTMCCVVRDIETPHGEVIDKYEAMVE
jgi:hypothetical protein